MNHRFPLCSLEILELIHLCHRGRICIRHNLQKYMVKKLLDSVEEIDDMLAGKKEMCQ